MNNYGFDTTDEHAATAALLVDAIYRSRNKNRFKRHKDESRTSYINAGPRNGFETLEEVIGWAEGRNEDEIYAA